MQNIPKVIQYGNVKPRGFATKYKRWEVNPQSSFNSFASNELLRFQLQTDGWIDPYASFMQIDVETNATLCGASQTTDPVHLELDGQATSLISQMIIYSDSKELERIDEYDQLGQILIDLGLGKMSRASKTYEGDAFEDCHSNQAQICSGQCQQFYVSQNTPGQGNVYSSGKSYFRATSLIDQRRGYMEGGPMVTVLPLGEAQLWLNTSLPRNKSAYDYNAILGLDGLDTEYGVEHLFNKVQGAGEVNTSYQNGITCGLKAPTSFALSGNKSQYLNDNVNTLKLINGQLVRNRGVDDVTVKVPNSFVKKQRFLVPFLSGVLGILIPSDQWKLIPGRALKNLLIEIRLNPFAFFTSSQYFGTNSLAKRGWRITQFKLLFDIWNFDEAVERYMDQQLSGEGIILSSQSWSMGPMYQVIANGSVTNNWQINNGIESIKSIVFWFLANDYLIYPQCRKHFRLSMNVLQYQLKIGGEFIPQQAIKGHAGNIAMNDTISDDNTEFVVELHKAFGFLFSATRSTDINKLNFAINDRSYDPNMENMTSAQLGIAGTAGDTPLKASGLSLYEERRVQGKALFALNLDSNPYDPEVLSGLDTTQKRPVELVIKGSDNDKFSRDATMFVMLNHDFYVQFTSNGTRTYGQG